jgi:hypothetical protein
MKTGQSSLKKINGHEDRRPKRSLLKSMFAARDVKQDALYGVNSRAIFLWLKNTAAKSARESRDLRL